MGKMEWMSVVIVMAITTDFSASLEQAELKRVYQLMISPKKCLQLCNRQASPRCEQIEVQNNICILHATISVQQPRTAPTCRKSMSPGVHDETNQALTTMSQNLSKTYCPKDFHFMSQKPGFLNRENRVQSCYHVTSMEKLSWRKAFDFCRTMKGDLLSIESEKEHLHIAAVIKYLKSYLKTRVHYYWTSGTDRMREGEFYWESTNRKLTYTNWSPGQPDNRLWQEDCIRIGAFGNIKWFDGQCSVPWTPICEAEVYY